MMIMIMIEACMYGYIFFTYLLIPSNIACMDSEQKVVGLKILATTPKQDITASFPFSTEAKLSTSQASPFTTSKLGCLKGRQYR